MLSIVRCFSTWEDSTSCQGLFLFPYNLISACL